MVQEVYVTDSATVTKAAELLGVSRRSLYHAIKNGRVPASQPLGENTAWQVHLADFIAKGSANPGDDDNQ